MAKPLTFAVGSEYRKNNYSIAQGEWASYIYGGAQSYPGFAPTDAGSFGRTGYAGLCRRCLRSDQAPACRRGGPLRTLSDFGSVWSGKFNARYDFNDKIGIRGTVSNGFRAPTLAEAYYSSVNVGPGSTFGQLPPNSAAAQLLGFPS
jgi:iron complex outermembrane receptor protein